MQPICLSDFIDRDDVRMVESGCRASLLPKAAEPVHVPRKFREQHLQGNPATQSSVLCKVYFSHPTGTEALQDVVVTYCNSRRWGFHDGGLRMNEGITTRQYYNLRVLSLALCGKS